MAWEAEYTWTTGEVLKIGGRLFLVSRHANGRPQVTLQDEAGRLLVMLASDAVKSIERPSPDEMARFLASFERSRCARQTANRACGILDGWGALLPARIVNEELGDYMEDINRRIVEGQRFHVYLRVAAAMFWTGINAIGYALKQLGRTKAA